MPMDEGLNKFYRQLLAVILKEEIFSQCFEAGAVVTNIHFMESLRIVAWKRRRVWHAPTNAFFAGGITRIRWERNGNGARMMLK